MKVPKRYLLLLVLALAAGAALWQWTRPERVAVTTARVERGTVRATVANTRAGTVTACRRARLAPASGGQIADLPVAEGDAVLAGQMLLEIWNDDLRAQLKLAEQELEAGKARAEQTCVGARVAQREAQRLTRLQAERLASEETAERARGEAESQAAACRAAHEDVGVGHARVEAALAGLERTRLRAPFDGTVAEINGEVGEFVTPSPVGIPTPPAIDLVDNSCLYISAPIDEVDAPRIRTGMPARVTLDAFPESDFSARVRRVAPYVLDIEKQARTVEIEAEIDQSQLDRLLPGYSADVEVIIAAHEDVLYVPTLAIVEGGAVYVVGGENHKLQRRIVQTGIGNWEHTEIVSGVAAGEQVVTSLDREGVRDGALVRIE